MSSQVSSVECYRYLDVWSCPFGGEALQQGPVRLARSPGDPANAGLQGCDGEVARTKVEIRSGTNHM